MIIFNLVLLLVTLTECHNHHHHYHTDNAGIGQGIKSYGGYIADTTGQHQNTQTFLNSQNYHQPQASSYQPYGWNFNQPRRTYGGVNVLNNQQIKGGRQLPTQFGWQFGYNNNFPQPNFFFPQFPFPTFPHAPFSGQFNPNFDPNFVPENHPGPHGNNYPEPHGNIHPGQGQLPYPTTYHGMPLPAGHEAGINHQGHPQYPQGNNIPSQSQPCQGIGHAQPCDNNNRVPSNGGQLPYPTTGHDQQPYPQGTPNTGLDTHGAPAIGHGQHPQQPYPHGTQHTGPTQGHFNPNQGTNQYIPPKAGHSPINPNLNRGEIDHQSPQKPGISQPDSPSGIDVRYSDKKTSTTISGAGSDKNSQFASHSFFGMNDNREWTDDDEQKWQATTKAPYFENKLPGLQCTLPAAAVLGAQNAFKASSLLPLNVPKGKPILSCNATDILQSQVSLDGKLYDCQNSEVIISCPSHGGELDECQRHILECDVNNSGNVWCSNGTLVSDYDIVVESTSIMPAKSVLNCFFKGAKQPGIKQQTTTRRTYINILPVIPLPQDLDKRNQNEIPVVESQEAKTDGKDLMPQLKTAMKDVFPHDLLSMNSLKYLPPKYLPPKTSMQSINPQLKEHIDGVFNSGLFAASQNEQENTVPSTDIGHTEISTGGTDINNNEWREQVNVNWRYNADRHNEGNSGTKTVENRFGNGGNQGVHQLQQRLIFSN